MAEIVPNKRIFSNFTFFLFRLTTKKNFSGPIFKLFQILEKKFLNIRLAARNALQI